MNQNHQEIAEIIAEVVPGWKIDATDAGRPLYELGMDSLDFASVLMALEDRFGFNFGEDELNKVRSFADICRFVDEKRA